ncbi:MAG: hypothetical protein AAB495_04670 [Patescibacteria group bacterium]
MEIQEILKQFKTIEPRRAYTEHSRSEILLVRVDNARKKQSGMFRVFGEIFQSVSAIVLTSVAIILVFGGFSVWRLIRPGLLALDPAGLRAEAQAIDIQIQLAGVEYRESTIAEVENSSGGSGVLSIVPASSDTDEKDVPSSTKPISIDEALEALLE